LGLALGLLLGIVNGVIVTVLKVPAIVATLGTLSIFRGIDYLIAGPDQVPLAGLPEGFTDAARSDVLGIPVFVLVTIVVVVLGSLFLRSTRFGRQVYAVGSNPEAAAILGIPSRRVVFFAFSACGLLAGLAGVMWVMEFGTINGTAATGTSLAIIAAVVVGGVSTLGGSGTLAGAAIGALFLGFIANALILVGLSQFWLQAIYGVVILVAIATDAVIRGSVKRAATRNAAR
jgi:rhamnose transport system permease protein